MRAPNQKAKGRKNHQRINENNSMPVKGKTIKVRKEKEVEASWAPAVEHKPKAAINGAVTIHDVDEPELEGTSVVVKISKGEHAGLRREFSHERHGADWKKHAEAFRARHAGEFEK